MATTYYKTKVPGIGVATGTATNGVELTSAEVFGSFFKLDFTFTDLVLTVTDAAGSGSSASQKIFDFVPGVVQMIGSRHNWTACAGSSAITTGAGDAAFGIAFGSAACAAGDGVAGLLTTDQDFGDVTAETTLSSNALSAAIVTIVTPGVQLDGTSTAVDIYLNWNGTAATIDASGTFTVTGTYTVWGVMGSDD